jgi:hypothetical protein
LHAIYTRIPNLFKARDKFLVYLRLQAWVDIQ